MIKLTFGFPPVAQARPRATRFGRGIRLYDLEQVHVYKAQLAESAQFMYHGEPLTGPLVVTIKFYRAIQQSETKKTAPSKGPGHHQADEEARLGQLYQIHVRWLERRPVGR